MATGPELLARFRERGLTLSLDAEGKPHAGPERLMTPETLAELRANKAAIVQALREEVTTDSVVTSGGVDTIDPTDDWPDPPDGDDLPGVVVPVGCTAFVTMAFVCQPFGGGPVATLTPGEAARLDQALADCAAWNLPLRPPSDVEDFRPAKRTKKATADKPNIFKGD